MTTSNVLYLIAGAAAGSVVTFLCVKEHYNKKAEATINEVRKYHENKDATTDENTEKAQQIAVSEGYSIPEVADRPEPKETEIHEIGEEEYGNEEGYDAIPTYIYYSNGIIVDESGDPIDQVSIAQTIGSDIHEREFDRGAIYLRNERIKCDFEIIYEDSDFVESSIRG